eukprot:TRINITY_DN9028_c0_g1_i1.p1 TRINITY_DN9028_c0_g1~~TRINITY_DN9028_c0_g1_i1.p1  ORF type:complete len:167 (+),score=51.27 TRINITY_DN9028_c0_g1_i1:48-503(+)
MSFNANLKMVTGVLVMKMAIVHLLTIRNRFIQGRFKVSEDHSFTNGGLKWVGDVFRVMLLAYGSPFSTIERLHGIVSNSIENEPYFLIACFALAQAGTTNSDMAQMVLAYGVTRVLHAFAYALELQPFRAIFFAVGLTINLFFGVKLTGLL